jgi:MFS family permease
VRAAQGRTRLLEGLRFVVQTPLLRTCFLIWTIGGFLIAPMASVVLPVYARQELGGAGDLAATITANGVGGLTGTLLFGLLAARLPRRRFVVAVWVTYALLSLGVALMPPFAGLLALLLAIGLVTGAYDPFEVTVHQELVPAELRARVFSVLLAAERSVVPLSMLLYGFLIEAAGQSAGLLMFAGGNALLAAYAIGNRPARAL